MISLHLLQILEAQEAKGRRNKRGRATKRSQKSKNRSRGNPRKIKRAESLQRKVGVAHQKKIEFKPKAMETSKCYLQVTINSSYKYNKTVQLNGIE